MKLVKVLGFWCLMAWGAAFVSSSAEGASDMLLIHGTIWTGDPERTWAEALWIQDGRVHRVGGSQELLGQVPAGTEVVDLAGAFVSPGLIDAHAHVLGFGLQLDRVDLVGAKSLPETLERLEQKVHDLRISERGGWVLGRGWDQNDWPEQSFPTRFDLDRICPDFPVALRRIDGHAQWVNTLALEQAGLNAGTLDPPGGKIHRDFSGHPTGILIDNAMDLVEKMIPNPTHLAKMNAIQVALGELVKVGLTGVHDMGMDEDDLSAYRELSQQTTASTRVFAAFSVTDPTLDRVLKEGPDQEWNGSWFKLGMIKFYLDGALGSRGAALLDDYSDDPHNRGLLLMDADTLQVRFHRALEGGFQVALHAIGDRGNRMALDVWSRLQPSAPAPPRVPEAPVSLLGPQPGWRPRVRMEHAQIVSLEDIPRFAELGVVASMQPTHCTSDMPWAPTRLGEERLKGAYAWRSFARHRVLLASGSDFPVESHDPLLGLYSAVTRRSLGTGEGWSSQERLGREEALLSFTAAPAYVSGDLDKLGTLTPGKLADLVVWDRNLITCDPELLPEAQVLQTIIGGTVVFKQHLQTTGGEDR